jgi:signal transduction histidine kinase
VAFSTWIPNLRSILDGFLNAGTSRDYSDFRNQLFRFANAVIGLIQVTLVGFLIVLRDPEHRGPFMIAAVAFVSYSIAYYLMRKHRQVGARLLSGTTGAFLIYFAAAYLGERTLLQVLLFCVSTISLVVYDWKEWKHATALTVFPLVLYGIGQATHFRLPGLTPFAGPLPVDALRTLSVSGAIFIVAAGMLYFRSQIKKHQIQIEAYVKRLQEEHQMQMHAHKMASLGEMAGGMAHEINTPLTAIAFRTSRLLQGIESGDVRVHAEKILSITQRIASIIGSLQVIAHSAENQEFETSNISRIVRDTVELCHQRFTDAGITLQIDVPEGLHGECRPGQIGQILLNLLNNAFDAADLSPHARRVEIRAFEESGWVAIIVRNSGIPISPQIRDRIFEPFFTTKRPGKGTGLGLSISRALAEEHHGSLEWVPDQAETSFLLKIPVRQPITEAKRYEDFGPGTDALV